MTADPKANAVLVDALGSALRRGGHALGSVPDLLHRVLDEGSWREFTTQRGEHVTYERFTEFVITKPLRGLGASDELIDRVVGTHDPDLLRKLRDVRKVGQGARTDLRRGVDSTRSRAAEDSANTAIRLARDAPAEYEAVRTGEKSLNAAARAAGIRRHRVSIRTDDAVSAARTLRKHMTPDQLVELARLLADER